MIDLSDSEGEMKLFAEEWIYIGMRAALDTGRLSVKDFLAPFLALSSYRR